MSGQVITRLIIMALRPLKAFESLIALLSFLVFIIIACWIFKFVWNWRCWRSRQNYGPNVHYALLEQTPPKTLPQS